MAPRSSGKFQPSRVFRLVLLLLGGAALVLVGQPSGARPPSPWNSYRVTLEDAQGNPLRTFHKDGTAFALGYLGERFNVRIENHSGVRVEAVLSVDGRDAITGGAGNYTAQRGYLIPAHGSVLVDGFRRSLDQVAAFRFSDPGSSYSSRMGTPENVGVVGVAFFPERYRAPRRLVEEETWRRDKWREPRPSGTTDDARPSPPRSPEARKGSGRSGDEGLGTERGERRRSGSSPSASSAPSRLGTEYGESKWSPVTEVPFQRENASRPAQIVTVRYDDSEGLRARGIEVYPRTWWEREEQAVYPQPFPASRFAPPPPGY